MYINKLIVNLWLDTVKFIIIWEYYYDILSTLNVTLECTRGVSLSVAVSNTFIVIQELYICLDNSVLWVYLIWWQTQFLSTRLIVLLIENRSKMNSWSIVTEQIKWCTSHHIIVPVSSCLEIVNLKLIKCNNSELLISSCTCIK